jgi:MFS family permease
MWFPLRVTFHGAITILFILSEFWINETAPSSKRGFVLGLYATVLSLGFAVGPLVFAAIGSSGILPFLVGSCIILISALPIVLARKQNPVLRTRPSVPFMRYLFIVPTATAAVFVFGAVESGGFSLFPVYSNGIGFDEGQGARLLTMIGLGNVLLQLPIGLLADRVRDRRVLLFAFALFGLVGSLMLPILSSDWWTLAVTLFIWGAVVAGLYTVGLAHLGSRLRGSELASANAAFIFSYSVGMMIGPQVLGISIGLAGPHGFAFGLAAFFAFYLLLALGRMLFRPAI